MANLLFKITGTYELLDPRNYNIVFSNGFVSGFLLSQFNLAEKKKKTLVIFVLSADIY